MLSATLAVAISVVVISATVASLASSLAVIEKEMTAFGFSRD